MTLAAVLEQQLFSPFGFRSDIFSVSRLLRRHFYSGQSNVKTNQLNSIFFFKDTQPHAFALYITFRTYMNTLLCCSEEWHPSCKQLFDNKLLKSSFLHYV